MFELNRQESEFAGLVKRLRFDDAPRPEHQHALRTAALAVYREQASQSIPSFWQRANQQGKAIMRRPASRYAACFAATVFVLVGWIFLPQEKTASASFYEFANSLVTARSARFKMEVSIPGQPNVKADALYLAPARMRQTMPGLISISDMQAGKMVTIKPEEKKAMVVTLTGRGKIEGQVDVFERLRAILADKARADESLKPIGEKNIKGRRALGFREETPMATLTIWGDPETGLPLQIATVMSGAPRVEVTWSDFELNVDLDETLFDTTPPEGYEVQTFDLDASPYKEQDLVESFRVASEINDGMFPDSIDTAASQRLIVKSVRGRNRTSDKEKMEKIMQLGAKIGRGFSFAMQLPVTADASYAGKGVKRDTPDTPIFWYRPEGATNYRVLHADLTIRDAATAPLVAGAVRIEKATPEAKSETSPAKTE